MQDIRQIRNQLLASCDWTQLVDAPLSDAQRATWSTYRQALRDITEGVIDPEEVIWPDRPNTELRGTQ
tara:strand:- start:942 stop:1145 length:204 start_codon:yes stop_codon:yes gene_type:complete